MRPCYIDKVSLGLLHFGLLDAGEGHADEVVECTSDRGEGRSCERGWKLLVPVSKRSELPPHTHTHTNTHTHTHLRAHTHTNALTHAHITNTTTFLP